jgi:hypothetical protein
VQWLPGQHRAEWQEPAVFYPNLEFPDSRAQTVCRMMVANDQADNHQLARNATSNQEPQPVNQKAQAIRFYLVQTRI